MNKNDKDFNIKQFYESLENKKYIEVFENGVIFNWFKKEGRKWIDFNDIGYSKLEIYIKVGYYLGCGFEVKSKF